MAMDHTPYGQVARPGYLAQVTLALIFIRDTSASGRLSIRNGDRFGLAHLYFRDARLIHVTGDKRDGESVLQDLITCSKGSVRFDAALMVNYETVTWQQAQVFARWLAFLEMRGIMQGIPRERLDGLVRSLTLHLPGEPIALPETIEHFEEHEEEARARNLQRFNQSVQQFVQRAIPEEQRHQLRQVTQRLNQVVSQAGDATQELTRRFARTTQQGLSQATDLAQEMARRGSQRAEELMQQNLNRERGEQLIQSVQETVESVKQAVHQQVDKAMSQVSSPLPPELQALSVRPSPVRALRTSNPTTGLLKEGQ